MIAGVRRAVDVRELVVAATRYPQRGVDRLRGRPRWLRLAALLLRLRTRAGGVDRAGLRLHGMRGDRMTASPRAALNGFGGCPHLIRGPYISCMSSWLLMQPAAGYCHRIASIVLWAMAWMHNAAAT